MQTNKQLQVVLTDDNPGDRFFFREMLEELGIDVALIECSNSAELQKHLEEVNEPPPPHLIFLDINMPGKSGIDCLKDIRQDDELRDVPVIMFSTSSHQKDIDATISGGANAYLTKTDTYEEGVKALKQVFDDYQSGAMSIRQ